MIKEYWDMHCHFVPGVDDGSKSMEMSMLLVDMEYHDGVRNIIVTPHFRRKMFTPSDELVVKNFAELKKAAEEKHDDLRLYLGCELHIHSEMMELLESDSPWKKTMAGSSWLLLEFKEGDPLSRITHYANLAARSGYKPILAHIERYDALKGQEDVLKELRAIGVKLQVNADALTGRDGFFVKNRARKWVKSGLISFVGSDGHNTTDRKPDMRGAAEVIERIAGREAAERILVTNPRKIVESLGETSDFV